MINARVYFRPQALQPCRFWLLHDHRFFCNMMDSITTHVLQSLKNSIGFQGIDSGFSARKRELTQRLGSNVSAIAFLLDKIPSQWLKQWISSFKNFPDSTYLRITSHQSPENGLQQSSQNTTGQMLVRKRGGKKYVMIVVYHPYRLR